MQEILKKSTAVRYPHLVEEGLLRDFDNTEQPNGPKHFGHG
jgi:hypothetical protein